MRALLDTQLLIWTITQSARLPRGARDPIEDGANTIVFSIASIWEAAIKASLRKPGFTLDPAELRAALLANDFTELPVAASHTFGLLDLPHIHRDPFDRILIAQARVEALTLLTTDRIIARYPGDIKRV